jgi:hypothetical protein
MELEVELDEPRPPGLQGELRFSGGPVDGQNVGYTNPWPPPPRLYAISGVIKGVTSYVTPEQLDHAAREVGGMGVLAERIDMAPYLRGAFSRLPDEQMGPHQLRLASYSAEL